MCIRDRSPTLFAPLDDPAGTTSPANLGTGGAALTVAGSGAFGAAGFASGTSSWAGGSSALVNGPVDVLDGDPTCSGFVTVTTASGVAIAHASPFGNPAKWYVSIQSLSAGAEVGVGFGADAAKFYPTSCLLYTSDAADDVYQV